MQNLRNTVLSCMRIRVPVKGRFCLDDPNATYFTQSLRLFSNNASVNQDHVIDRVISLVKKFDKIDAAKVTEKADFQKDLSLDSLDRVELVMAFEEEFSVEILDAEVAKYVVSSSEKLPQSS